MRYTRYILLVAAMLWSATAQAQVNDSDGESAAGPQQDARGTVEGAVERASERSNDAGRDAVETDESGAEEQATDSFERFVDRQASLEVQLGLRFYQEFDDYRAITSFRRYRFLDGTPEALFLSSLMIGQIYHRNDKPDLAIGSFEDAARAAPSDYHKTFAYLMALQEACLPLSLYVACRVRLGALAELPLEPQVRELVDYQLLYTDVVLRSDTVTSNRADEFDDDRLAEQAVGLVQRSAEFEDLRIKRPWLSGTLSAVVPGAGQLYNGRPVDALLSFGVNAAFGVGTYFAFAEAKSIPLGVVVAVLAAGFYTGNIVNAVTDARKINAERYRAFFEQLKLDYWPRVAFRIEEDEVLFSYGFDWPGPKLEPRSLEASDVTEESPESETK